MHARLRMPASCLRRRCGPRSAHRRSLAAPALADRSTTAARRPRRSKAAIAKARDDTEAAMEGVDAEPPGRSRCSSRTRRRRSPPRRPRSTRPRRRWRRRSARRRSSRPGWSTPRTSRRRSRDDRAGRRGRRRRCAPRSGRWPARRTRAAAAASGVDVVLDAESTEDFVQRYGLMSTALRTQAQILDAAQGRSRPPTGTPRRGSTAVQGQDRRAQGRGRPEGGRGRRGARPRRPRAKAELDDLLAQQVSQQAALDAQQAAARGPAGRRPTPRPPPIAEPSSQAAIAAQKAPRRRGGQARTARPGPIGDARCSATRRASTRST